MFFPVIPSDRRKRWLPVAFLSILAVAAGLALPRALSSMPAAPPEATVARPAATMDKAGKKSDWNYTPPEMPDAPDARSLLTRLGVATAIVLVLCVGTLLLGKRWLGSASQPAAQGKQLRLIESLSLGNRCTLHLIHVANRSVLVGADPSGVRNVVPLPESFLEHTLAASEMDLGAEPEKDLLDKKYQQTMPDHPSI